MGTLADLAESGDADALSAAIADGANLDEADDEGNTATHKAAQGEPECLRLLLSHGATVDSANAERPKIRAVREDFGTAFNFVIFAYNARSSTWSALLSKRPFPEGCRHCVEEQHRIE